MFYAVIIGIAVVVGAIAAYKHFKSKNVTVTGGAGGRADGPPTHQQ